jgi:hypothetical protein
MGGAEKCVNDVMREFRKFDELAIPAEELTRP